MKKLFGLLLFAGILFASCDNSEDEVLPNVFKFTVNGIEKDFSSNVIVEYEDLFGMSFIDAISGTDTFTIDLSTAKTGEFTKENEQAGFINNGLMYTSNNEDFDSYWSDSEYTIKVTKYVGQADIIEGTFSGTLVYKDFSDIMNYTDSVVTITNGKFYVTK